MKTTYFKTIIQKTSKNQSILVAVIPNDMLGNLPDICEMQAVKVPSTVYTGTYPTIKLNTDTIKDRVDLKGDGIAGIITEEMWYTKDRIEEDLLGISL